MTPARKVAGYEQRAKGAVLRLECGHQVWVGGMEVRPLTHPCGQSPCYRPERAMGSGDGIYGGRS